MSLSTESPVSEGADGLYLDLKVVVGSVIVLKIGFVSAPSFRFEMMYVDVFSKKDSNDVAFFFNLFWASYAFFCKIIVLAYGCLIG